MAYESIFLTEDFYLPPPKCLPPTQLEKDIDILPYLCIFSKNITYTIFNIPYGEIDFNSNY